MICWWLEIHGVLQITTELGIHKIKCGHKILLIRYHMTSIPQLLILNKEFSLCQKNTWTMIMIVLVNLLLHNINLTISSVGTISSLQTKMKNGITLEYQMKLLESWNIYICWNILPRNGSSNMFPSSWGLLALSICYFEGNTWWIWRNYYCHKILLYWWCHKILQLYWWYSLTLQFHYWSLWVVEARDYDYRKKYRISV